MSMTGDARDLGPALVASSVSLLGLTGLLVGSRLWVRLTLSAVGWDDVLIMISWICNLGLCTATLLAVPIGFGRPPEYIRHEDMATYAKLILCCSVTWSWGTAMAKCSFAVLYLRLLPNCWSSWLNRCVIVFLVCQGTEEMLVALLQCRPVYKGWEPSAPGTCISLLPMWWTGFVSNLITDWILFLQPMPFVWKLQLISTAKKVGLSVMLSLGLFICVISIKRIIEAARSTLDDNLAEPMIWSIAELSALIVCSSIPALRLALFRFPRLNRMLGLSSSSSSPRNYIKSGASAASRFFFNRRVRYGRSSNNRSGGHTEIFDPEALAGGTTAAKSAATALTDGGPESKRLSFLASARRSRLGSRTNIDATVPDEGVAMKRSSDGSLFRGGRDELPVFLAPPLPTHSRWSRDPVRHLELEPQSRPEDARQRPNEDDETIELEVQRRVSKSRDFIPISARDLGLHDNPLDPAGWNGWSVPPTNTSEPQLSPKYHHVLQADQTVDDSNSRESQGNGEGPHV